MGLSDNRVYNPKSKNHHFRGTYNQGPSRLIPIAIFMVLCFIFPFQEDFSLHKDTGDSNGATWISIAGLSADKAQERLKKALSGCFPGNGWWEPHG